MNDNRLNNLDKMMDDYVYGLLETRQSDRILRKIEEDPEWQLAYEEAVYRKRLLTGAVVPGELSKAPPAGATAARAITSAQTVYGARKRRRRILRWSSGAAALAASVVIGVMWIAYATIAPPAHTVRLVGQNELISGSTVSLKAIVTDLDNRPSPNIPVNLLLTGGHAEGYREIHLASWRTDDTGVASGRVSLPTLEGRYHITAKAGSNRFQLIGAPIELKRASRVFLATDKPIYQPGQTIHIRTLVLQKSSLKPDAGRKADLSVTDPANNVIFRETRTLSDYGLAWADLALDSLVTPGRYRITATAGDDESVQTVEISHYKLPAFSVKITTDKPYYRPGETLSGKVHLKYNFGKPVKGAKVDLELIDRTLGRAHLLSRIDVTAGDSGSAGFEIPLPKTLFGTGRAQQSAHLLLSVTAADPAGQENTGYRNIAVSPVDIRIATVMEGGSSDKSVPAKLFVVTSYPDGRPARTIVDVRDIGRSIRTDDTGVAVIESSQFRQNLRISARDEKGLTGHTVIQTPQSGGSSLVLRTDKPIYQGGDTIGLQVLAGEVSQVFVDVVKDRQTVLTQAVQMENGRGTAGIDIPPMLSGTLRLHAYRLDSEGQWIGRDAIIVVKQAGGLKVAMTSGKQVHRPGQDAKLDFRVTDADGKPQAAAISLAGVDEAVFSLQQAAPGLEGLMNGLDEELLIPAVEVHNLSLGLMDKSPRYAEAVLTAAANETSKHEPQIGEAAASLHSLDVNNKVAAGRAFRRARRDAEENASTVSFWGGFGIAFAAVLFAFSFISVSTDARGINWVGVAVTMFLVGVIATLAIGAFSMKAGMETQAYYCLAADGGEDKLRTDWQDGDAGSGTGDAAPLDPMTGDVVPSIVPTATPVETTEGAGKPAKPVRTRTYFPETMLWRPQVITDPQGRATLTIPLADSITTWRISGSAVSKTGRLGRVSGAVKVFQPFFVDINAPTTLTRGDEVSLPLVLYNYADNPLSVRLTCSGDDGLKVLGEAPGNVVVEPGDVAKVMVRVQADKIGDGTLKVLAVSDAFSDSIRRDIRITPPGRPAWAVVNGTLSDGRQTVDVSIPADAVDGSLAMRLKLYPSTFSELMDGLEGIFRQPNGCFEQTSSTTYPNVMALSYMRANKMDNPEAAAKASRYIQMGYQRLLSFEIQGGGFDWFGRGPANVVLTAYGLMEFADMAKVHNVDPKLLERTADWLASRQDSRGVWKFRPGCFHEPFTGGDNGELATTAYVTWAIASYNPDHPAAQRGAKCIAKHSGEASNVYTLALCANALRAANSPEASALIEQLAEKRKTVGKDQTYWSAGGHSNDIRATELAILAMRGESRYATTVSDALRWIASKRDPAGTWGATQSTIMALKALTEGAPKAGGKRDSDATLTIGTIGSQGKPVVMKIPAGSSDAVHTAVIEPVIGDGAMQLVLDAKGSEGLPYQVVIHYYTQEPAPRAQAPVQIRVDYDRSKLQVGQTVTVRAMIANTGPTTANMLLADVGTPPGFAVNTTTLEKLKASGKIDRYTVTARGVIFYINKLDAGSSMTLEYKMTAKIPLKAQAASTTVYPYYEPHQLSAATATTFIVSSIE